jgi:ligand-binding sensor domain-containing protein
MIFCNLILAQTSNKISTFTPSNLTIGEEQSAEVILRIFINNLTNTPGLTSNLTANLVLGNYGDDLRWTSKRTATFEAEYLRDVDECDEFKATIKGLRAGQYSFICTFTYNGLEYPVGYVTTPDDGFFHMGNITVNAIQNVDLTHWQDYIGCGRVVAVAEDENFIWAGGSGLARINKTTDEVTLFTRVNSGLPDNNITSIVVDKNGNKWIATGSGLVRFDGINWTKFNTKNSAILSDFTYDLAEDSKGNIWVGTYEGISKFDGSNWSNFESTLWSSSSSYKAAYKLAIDNNDIVWAMVSYSGTVVKFDGITWTLYERGKSFIPQNASTRTIAVDKNNKLWLSYYAFPIYGVIVYDGSNSIDYNTSNTPALPQSYLSDIFVDENDNKWFAGNGYVIFDNNNWTAINTENSGLSDSYVNCIFANSSGEIYAGTNYGLDKFKGNWKNFSFGNKPELNYYGVQGFAEASNGDVWINSWEGLTKVSNGVWTSYNSQNTPILSSQINKIVFDRNGTLCVGLTNGLAKYDGSNWQLFDKSNSGLPDTYVWDIAVDPSANVWLATDAGIIKYDGSNWTTFKKADRGYTGTSYSEAINNIASDSKGNIFAGWNGGFTALRDNVWINYDSKNSILKSNYVSSYSLDIDKNDNIWWSTNSYGAYEYTNDGVWKEYNTTNSGLPSNSIRKIFIDAQNNLWFCTYGWGVAKYDGTTWSYLTTANSGLGCNSTRSILIDKSGNYWIGTFAGLSYYNPNVVGVEQDYQNIPTQFELSQNYPNPFNPETTIKYQIPESGRVSLKIYDVLGREVANLVNEFQSRGNYTKMFNAASLSSGVYFYRLQAGNYSATKKLILVK